MCTTPTYPRTIASVPPRHRYLLLLPLVVAIIAYLPLLTQGALRHWDEAWYASVSREMLRESSWLTVRWNGSPWFHKPPLTLWGTAAAFHVFGISELSARLPSFGCALATLWLLSKFQPSPRYVSRASAAMLAPILLLLLPEFARYACRGQMDVPLTLCITAQVYGFWRGLSEPRWHWLSGLAFGTGLMTKGVASALGIAISGFYILAARDGRALRQRSFWLAPALGLLVAAPWHIHQIVQHGWSFTEEYFTRQAGQVVTDSSRTEDAPAASLIYYLKYLLRHDLPWGWLILTVIAVATRTALRGRDRLLTLAWCWTLSVPLLLSLARAKWSWYLLPMYPGAALLTSLLAQRSSLWQKRPVPVLIALVGIAFLQSLNTTRLPANSDHEQEIRSLESAVRRYVHPRVPLHTLQTEYSRLSVYPIAVGFYADRQVHAVHGLVHLEAIIENAANPFFLMVHEEVIDELRSSYPDSLSKAQGIDAQVELLGRSGPICLVRIHPRPVRPGELRAN